MAKSLLRTFLISVIVLLVLTAGFFLYRYFIPGTAQEIPHNYLIENKYYSFKLQTPADWIARENTLYSEDNITKFLADCKNDNSNNATLHQLGIFRFTDKKFPQGFGDPGYFPGGLPSGAILEISVNCIPDVLKIAGEKSYEKILNLAGFGNTKQISFLHNNFQYNIREYVYISPGDKTDPVKLKSSYLVIFNKIISSFNFVK